MFATAGAAAARLAVGRFGYRTLVHLRWILASLDASMILGRMSPVDPLSDEAVRLFASTSALFAGAVFPIPVVSLV